MKRPVLLISHRLANVTVADEIFVLEADGRDRRARYTPELMEGREITAGCIGAAGTGTVQMRARQFAENEAVGK